MGLMAKFNDDDRNLKKKNDISLLSVCFSQSEKCGNMMPTTVILVIKLYTKFLVRKGNILHSFRAELVRIGALRKTKHL